MPVPADAAGARPTRPDARPDPAPQRLQRQRFPHQRSSLDLNAAKLSTDIVDDAIVRRGGRTEHRHIRRHAAQDVDQPAVVRSKVVPPIGNTVRLVDYQQTNALRNWQQHVREKSLVREALAVRSGWRPPGHPEFRRSTAASRSDWSS